MNNNPISIAYEKIVNDHASPDAFPKPSSKSITIYKELAKEFGSGKKLTVEELSELSPGLPIPKMRETLNELAYVVDSMRIGMKVKRDKRGRSYQYWIEVK